MIFLLLCGAAPAMKGTAEQRHLKTDAKSIWIEIDSQVLTGLFCVTGFGLIPWRLRDLIFLMQYRLQHKYYALNKLATIHKGWFRLDDHGPRSDDYIVRKSEGMNPPDLEAANSDGSYHPQHRITRTGEIAPPSKLWLMDAVVWFNVWNTLFQAALCGAMWGLNRRQRPGAVTAILIVAAFGCGIGVGVVALMEGKRIKKIEGRPLIRKATPYDDSVKAGNEKPKPQNFFRRTS